MFTSKFVQTPVKFDVLTDIDRVVISSKPVKNVGTAKLKCALPHPRKTRPKQPTQHEKTYPRTTSPLVFDLDAAADTIVVRHRFSDLFENTRPHDRVGINKYDDVAVRGFGPSVSDPGNVVFRFVDYSDAELRTNVACRVGAFVIDDNYLVRQ